MKTIRIQTKEPYDVLVGSGILQALGSRVEALSPKGRRKAAVVCDDKVRALYGQEAERSLRRAGYDVCVIDFPHGAPRKDMETAMNILDQFASHRLDSGGLVVALGGGVTADLAGFAAALYLGGVDWVLAPTTLVAAVDSSVGGVCAVDLSGRRDQVSVVHQPAMVLCDTDTLSTLDGDLLLDGMALVVQRACVRDAELFLRLEKGGWQQDLTECIARSVELKSAIMAVGGLGPILSFGGELARGIVQLSRHRFSQGKAAAVGMCLTGEACVKHGLLDPVEAHRIRRLLERMGLPTQAGFPVADICRAGTADPTDRPIELVLLERVGKASVRTMDAGGLSSFYKVLQ